MLMLFICYHMFTISADSSLDSLSLVINDKSSINTEQSVFSLPETWFPKSLVGLGERRVV